MSDDFEAGPNARALLEAIPPGDWNAFRLVRGVAEALRQLKQDQPGIYQELWDRKISLAVTGSVVALMAYEPENLKPYIIFRPHGPPYEGFWRHHVPNAADKDAPWLAIPDRWVADAVGREAEQHIRSPEDEDDPSGELEG